MNTWKYSANSVVTNNFLISLCCCNTTAANLLWEAVPCDMLISHRTKCFEPSDCSYTARRFLDGITFCNDDTQLVCECQRLKIYGLQDYLSLTAITHAISVAYTGGAGAYIIWADALITVNDSNNPVYLINPSGRTLLSIIIEINALTGTHWSLGISGIDSTLPSTVISPATLSFSGAATQYFDTKTSNLRLMIGSVETGNIAPNTDPATFATNIETALNAVLTGTITVDFNSLASIDGNNSVFEIVFGGALCGIPIANMYVSAMELVYTGSYTAPLFEHGNYICAPGDSSEHYYMKDSFATACPYDSTSNQGPGIFNSSIQCCPQKGATFGGNQNLDPDPLVSGYSVVDQWDNLENTVVLGGSCYGVRPAWFTIGKEGRYNYDFLNHANVLFVESDKTTSNITGLVNIPTNCVTELFLPKLNKNVPWGPFGSYYPYIEIAEHPSWANPTSYLYGAFTNRFGWDYRPQAFLRTHGTWLETTGIELTWRVWQARPFYVGSATFDDMIRASPDPATVSSAFITGVPINATGFFRYIYPTSGKTVGDFVTDINAIKVKSSGVDQSCFPFAFCLASDSASSTALNLVVNTTSDIWDLAVKDKIDGGTLYQTTYNVDRDPDLKSGSVIQAGTKPYWDMFTNKVPNGCFTENTTGFQPQWTTSNPLIYNIDPDDPPFLIFEGAKRGNTPPICRLKHALPKDYTSSLSPTELIRDIPWYTTFQGKTEDVLSINLTNNVTIQDSTIRHVYVGVSGQLIMFRGVREDLTEVTGAIQTNRGGSDYTVSGCMRDINAFQWPNPAATLYSPFSSTGLLPYKVWLDDRTYQHPAGGYPMPSGAGAAFSSGNYSFKEPLLDKGNVDIYGGTTNLQSWIRRRCEYYDSTTTLFNNDYRLKRCVPDAMRVYGSGSSIDCSSDSEVDASWLASYGCGGNVCKTQWYIRAQRCPCDDVYRCTNGDGQAGAYVHHPYNFPGDDTSNTDIWSSDEPCANISVNQPTLYVCDYNIHPECDIPFLVKVPYQVIKSDTVDPSCTDYDQWIYYVYYGDDSGLSYQSDEFGCLSSWSFCGPDAEGWCQYIDPSNKDLVAKIDIPRSFPAQAYVMERSIGVFCSTTPFGDGLPMYPLSGAGNSCGSWDRLCGVYPYYPASMMESDGLPCNIDKTNGVSDMCALARPIINNFTQDDYLGDANCSRIDINCGTKCCECFFNCTNDGCATSLERAPCLQTIRYQETSVMTGLPADCNHDPCSPGNPGGCNYGCCFQGAAPCMTNTKLGMRYTETTNIDLTKYEHYPCGCLGVEGSIDVSRTVTGTDCSYSGYISACTATDCNGVNTAICSFSSSSAVSCSEFDDGFKLWHCSADATGSSIGRECGDTCGGSFSCVGAFTKSEWVYTCDQSYDVCGTGSETYTNTTTTYADGSTVVEDGCFSGDHELRLSDGSYTTIVWTQTITKTVSEQLCASCTTDGLAGQSYSYILSWVNDFSRWSCSLPNSASTETGVLF